MSESRKLALVPATVAELLKLRKNLTARNLNDDVEQIHLRLWEKEEYQKYFRPIWRAESIEGNFLIDEAMAAMQVRAYAINAGNDFPIAKDRDTKLQAIVNSLHVVLKRYGLTRKERRRTVGGEIVDMNGDGNEDI